MKKKGKTLLAQFATMFVIFIVITMVISALAVNIMQSRTYYEQYQELLRKVNSNIATRLETEIDDFAELQAYFVDHHDEFDIPYEYGDSAGEQYRIFLTAFENAYPGKSFGKDVTFLQLNDEVKLLYARYKYLEWLIMFDQIKADYELDYAYYVIPAEQQDYVTYMFDGPRDKDENDETKLLLAWTGEEDRNLHKNMWYAMETGQTSAEMDRYDNEYGHVYTLSTPLKKGDEVLGVIMTDVNFNFVSDRIRTSVISLDFIYLIILGICSFGMIFFVRNHIISRIGTLEKDVEEYASTKDPAMAGTILEKNPQIDEIGSLAKGFSSMIEELQEHMVNLQKVTAEKERIGAELDIATEIQASMLPRIFPAFPEREDFEIFASMDPAKEVGGDFYDFYMVDEDHIVLTIADVSGKGVPAALFMAISKALIKDQALTGKDPAQILRDVNNQLCTENDAGLFVTVWLGIVDLKTHKLVFADAGHEYPFVIHIDGTCETIQSGRKRPPVATIEDIPYNNKEYELRKGDILFLYTDGVPEATNAGLEMYGMERLTEVLSNLQGMTATRLLPLIRENVDEFVGDAEQFDDLTMLAFRILD